MNEQTLFLQALDQPAGEARRKWLEKECQDLGQRKRIANLLKRHEAAGSFLESPPAEFIGRAVANHASDSQASKSITKAKFVDRLIRSKLMTAEEVTECDLTLQTVQRASDARTYARALVEANVLTTFQAKAIYDARIKGLTFGEYIILDQLGKGGMGIVYRAKHRRMDRLVAIKVLPRFAMATKGLVGRFYREVKTAGKLMHPNIVAALDASEDDGMHYLVMEYVEGQDLGKLLRESGALELTQAVNCVIQAAKGLQYAHEQGVVHRDIKPANLLLDTNGVVKILDMGLARVTGAVSDGLGDTMSAASSPSAGDTNAVSAVAESPSWEEDTTAADEQTRLTKAGEVMGTLDYMSPEQFTDSRSVDARGDIYSLGCTLYRLLTNQRPFPADTVGAVFDAHHHAPIPSLRAIRPDIPEPLEAVFQRMLAKDPNQRPSSMFEVIRDLEKSRACTRSAGAITLPRLKTEEDRSVDAKSSGASLELVSAGRKHSQPGARRGVPVGWIVAGSVAVSLLIVYGLTLADFLGSEEKRLASSNKRPSKTASTPAPAAEPKIKATEILDASLVPASDKPNDRGELSLQPGPRTTLNEMSSNEPSTNDGKAPASTKNNNETVKTGSEQQPNPAQAPSEQGAPNKSAATPWNGTTFSWSSGLPQGGTKPLANRFVEFNDNGRRVSISQNSERIAVTVDERVVEAPNPDALKKKDRRAYLLYEKMFGSPVMKDFPASAMNLQRDQIEQLLKAYADNPQMKSVLEKMLRAQEN